MQICFLFNILLKNIENNVFVVVYDDILGIAATLYSKKKQIIFYFIFSHFFFLD